MYMLNNPNVCKFGCRETYINYRTYIQHKADNIILKINSSKLDYLEKSIWVALVRDNTNNAIITIIRQIEIFTVTKRLIKEQARLSEVQNTIKTMEVQLRIAIIDNEMACSKINSLITTITLILDEAMVIKSQSTKESSVSEAKQPLVLESEAQLSKFLAQQQSESVAQQLLVLSTQKPLAAQQSSSSAQQSSSSAVQQLAQQPTDEISLNAKRQRRQ